MCVEHTTYKTVLISGSLAPLSFSPRRHHSLVDCPFVSKTHLNSLINGQGLWLAAQHAPLVSYIVNLEPGEDWHGKSAPHIHM